MKHTATDDANIKTAVMAYLAIGEVHSGSDKAVRAPPTLYYRGQKIIHLDDMALALHLSKKTIRKYRDDGLLEVYESHNGNIMFVTEEGFNNFVDNFFICSSHPDYSAVKKRIKSTTTKS